MMMALGRRRIDVGLDDSADAGHDDADGDLVGGELLERIGELAVPPTALMMLSPWSRPLGWAWN